jgi:hypothetical protein
MRKLCADVNLLYGTVQVDIYPLRIFLTEAMYTKLWKYFFPDEEQDVKRQV